jgi:hypothetical protein
VPYFRLGRVPRKPLDAPENLSEEAPCQLALGHLEDEVSGMSIQAPAGLEEPLLQARQEPALDGSEQDQPAHEVAEIVADDPQQQPHLVGPEAVAGEADPMGGFFAFLDPLLRRPVQV